jgi:SAM-dependent methyltransferase
MIGRGGGLGDGNPLEAILDSQQPCRGNAYVLGSHPDELARLDRQAVSIEPATRLLLQAAGLRPGMRVLDLGTGLGHVARLAAELVAPTGSVVGLDRSLEALAVARQRVESAGERHVSFVEGDAGRWRCSTFRTRSRPFAITLRTSGPVGCSSPSTLTSDPHDPSPLSAC